MKDNTKTQDDVRKDMEDDIEININLDEIFGEDFEQDGDEKTEGDGGGNGDSDANNKETSEEESEKEAEEETDEESKENSTEDSTAQTDKEDKKEGFGKKLFNLIKKMPQIFLTALVAATSFIGSVFKSLVFGASSYTLPPEPDPLSKFKEEKNEENKKEKGNKEKEKPEKEKPEKEAKEKENHEAEKKEENLDNERKESGEELDKGGNEAEQESETKEDAGKEEESTEEEEKDTEEESGEEETSNEEQEEEPDAEFSEDDMEQAVDDASQEEEAETNENEEAGKEEGKEEEPEQKKQNYFETESGKKSLERLNDVFHVKFQVGTDIINGEERNYISIEKNNMISRRIDADKLQKGDASELAVACKDVNLSRPVFRNDAGDSKYVMTALGMCSKIRNDMKEEQKQSKGRFILAKCSLGDDYKAEFFKHRYDGGKYEYSITGMDKKDKDSYKNSHISDNEKAYKLAVEAESVAGKPSVLDSYSKQVWSKSEKISTRWKNEFSDETKAVCERIADEINGKLPNDEKKVSIDDVHNMAILLNTSRESKFEEGVDSITEALFMNSKELSSCIQCVLTDKVTADAKAVLGNADGLSSSERHDLTRFIALEHNERQIALQGNLLDGTLMGKTQILQNLAKRNDFMNRHFKQVCEEKSLQKPNMCIAREIKTMLDKISTKTTDGATCKDSLEKKSLKDVEKMTKDYMYGVSQNSLAFERLLQQSPTYQQLQENMIEKMISNIRNSIESGNDVHNDNVIKGMFEQMQTSFPVMREWNYDRFTEAVQKDNAFNQDKVIEIANQIQAMENNLASCPRDFPDFMDITKQERVDTVWKQIEPFDESVEFPVHNALEWSNQIAQEYEESLNYNWDEEDMPQYEEGEEGERYEEEEEEKLDLYPEEEEDIGLD